MKRKLFDFGSFSLLLASAVLGTLTAHSFFSDVAWSHFSANSAGEASVVAPSFVDTGESSHQYVQEPLGRSSFRPDFSRGLRRANQRNNYAMLRAFNDSVSETRKSTVQLRAAGVQVALGAIVDADGWIATKASELPASGELLCQLYDNTEYPAEIVQTVPEFDLALLRIDRSGLGVVDWESAGIPGRGAWLATTDIDAMPSAVGVVSAGIQQVKKSSAVLGVHLDDRKDGAVVKMVLPGSGAEAAGLKLKDVITSVNGIRVFSHQGFQEAIKETLAGHAIRLSVHRADRNFDVDARLMDLSEELRDETEMEVNGLVSARATGFPRVFLHDTVLSPNQCGGPLCNLDGKVVGLNIARASRVTSYALPADVVRPLVDGLIAQERLVSRPLPSAASQSELGPIR